MRKFINSCRNLILIGLISVCIPGLYAQTSWDTPTALQGMIEQMKSNFPKLKELHQMDQTFEYRRDLARGAYFPIIGASVDYHYMTPVVEFLDFAGNSVPIMPNHAFNAEIYVNHPIWDFGKTKANIDKVDSEREQLAHNIEFTEKNLAYQLASIYYNMLYLEKSLAIQDSEMVAAKVSETITLNRFNAGDALEVDLLNTRVRIDQIQNRITDIKTGLDKQRSIISYMTGEDYSNFSVDLNYVFPGADAILSLQTYTLMENNNEIMASIDKLLIAKQDLELNSKQGYPTLALHASGGMKNGYFPDMNIPKANVLAGVSVSFPFFAGFRFKSMTKIARNQVAVAELAVETANAEAEKNYDQALKDYLSAEEKLQRFTNLIDMAEKALKITNSRYNNGLITSYELILAQNNLESSKMAKVQMEYQRWQAILEMNRVMGTQFWD